MTESSRSHNLLSLLYCWIHGPTIYVSDSLTGLSWGNCQALLFRLIHCVLWRSWHFELVESSLYCIPLSNIVLLVFSQSPFNQFCPNVSQIQ